MTLPLIGFVSPWIIVVIAVLLLLYFFGKKGLHFFGYIVLALLLYWIIRHFI